jgi:hypothetical protein
MVGRLGSALRMYSSAAKPLATKAYLGTCNTLFDLSAITSLFQSLENSKAVFLGIHPPRSWLSVTHIEVLVVMREEGLRVLLTIVMLL